jgi:hypothetical protein
VKVAATPCDDLASASRRRSTTGRPRRGLDGVLRLGSQRAGAQTLAGACARQGAELLVDVYHSLGVVPLLRGRHGGAFVVGGGYKYLQLGEGNCFAAGPPDCALRPVVTGWFAEFAASPSAAASEVTYGRGPWRFAGSTYDPTSPLPGERAVLAFFAAQCHLVPPFLREVSQHQVGLLAETFLALDLHRGDPSRTRRAARAARWLPRSEALPRGEICTRAGRRGGAHRLPGRRACGSGRRRTSATLSSPKRWPGWGEWCEPCRRLRKAVRARSGNARRGRPWPARLRTPSSRRRR